MEVVRDPHALSGFDCKSPLPSLPLLTHCGESTQREGSRLVPHSHPGFEFLYLVRGGKGRWRVFEESCMQERDDVIVIYPEETHWLIDAFEPDTFRVWVGIDLEGLGPAGVTTAHLLRQHKVRLLRGAMTLLPVMRAIVAASITQMPGQEEVVKAYLHTLLALVRQHLQCGEKPGVRRVHLPYSRSVQRTIAYMHRHRDRRLSLTEMIEVASTSSRSHFCAVFRQEVGLSPANYHLKLRLDAANAELTAPTADITEIALRHGFASSQHFSTAFRSAYGLTPLERKKGRLKTLRPARAAAPILRTRRRTV